MINVSITVSTHLYVALINADSSGLEASDIEALEELTNFVGNRATNLDSPAAGFQE